MNILAFDTCFDACSVAVRRADGSISAERELMRRGHAEALLPMIERTMAAADVGFQELDRIAVTHGPGMFTGTRVGVAAALGLGLAHATPVATYSSLQCVARAAIDALGADAARFAGIIVARDARRDSVFIELADIAGNAMCAQDTSWPALLTLADARSLVESARQRGPFFATGSGAALLAEADAGLVTEWPGDKPSDGIDQPDARYMLADAAGRPASDAPRPLYLRAPDATPSSVPPLARLATTSDA